MRIKGESLCIGFLLFVFSINLVFAAELIVPDQHSTIQDAIDNSSNGDMIIVNPGFYEENIVIDKKLIVMGNGSISDVIINGSASSAVRITSDDVTFKGFTVTNPVGSSSTVQGVTIASGSDDIIVRDNIVKEIGIVGSLDFVEGIYSNPEVSDIEIINNTVYNLGSGTTERAHGIMIYSPDDESDEIEINYNRVFNVTTFFSAYGISLNHYITDTLISGNKIYDIAAGSFAHGIVAWGGDVPNGIDAPSAIDIRNNEVFRISGLVLGGSGIGSGGNSTFYEVSNNTVYNNTAGIFVDVKRDFDAFNNTVYNNCLSVLVARGENVEINYNSFINNNCSVPIPPLPAYGFLSTSSENVSAMYNHWGSCTGPSGIGPGTGDSLLNGTSANVSFYPWLGNCIENKSGGSCSIEGDNVTLYAQITGIDIKDVIFTLDINGTAVNKTGAISGNNTYSAQILSSEIVSGQNISWNVLVEDLHGNEETNGLQNFYTHIMTNLSISPSTPDGLSGWYVTEPVFTLIGDLFGVDIFYRWNSNDFITYTGPFGLDDIPNAPPKESAGILDLHYFSEFSCGNETEKEDLFFIDLKDPEIVDLNPASGEMVGEKIVNISAYLDEVYQSNSGINLSSVVMKVDGSPVNATVNAADSLDATVSYFTELSEGDHSVMINVSDNAGRHSSVNWTFKINSSLSFFNMTVYMPTNGLYDDKKVPFNITTSKEVEKVEYINYNDTRPKWKRLCRNCDSYGFDKKRTKNLREGNNELGFRAIDELGNQQSVNVSVFVDDDKPKIRKTIPVRGFSKGDFEVEFREKNPVNLSLHYGNDTYMNMHMFNLSSCVEERTKTICNTNVNVTEFNEQEIMYYANLSDITNKTSISRTREISVDLTPPAINSFGLTNIGRRVEFTFNITEMNFDELSYIDHNDKRPRERRLCSRLDDGICQKTKTFRTGDHNLTINVLDEAGNNNTATAFFYYLVEKMLKFYIIK